MGAYMGTKMELSPVFARRLYLTLLLEESDRPNVPRLMQMTGWPRRTIQDVIKSLSSLGIELIFVQKGCRHNDGYYCLKNWGPLNREWVAARKEEILASVKREND